jgi:hypothetical protein
MQMKNEIVFQQKKKNGIKYFGEGLKIRKIVL